MSTPGRETSDATSRQQPRDLFLLGVLEKEDQQLKEDMLRKGHKLIQHQIQQGLNSTKPHNRTMLDVLKEFDTANLSKLIENICKSSLPPFHKKFVINFKVVKAHLLSNLLFRDTPPPPEGITLV